MKKILSFLLALVMIFSLSVTAFAADNVNTNNGSSSANVTGSYVAGTAGGVIFSVDIAWTGLNFTYNGASEAVWDPETHTYEGETTEAGWADSDAYITITNHSNAYIYAFFTYTKNEGYEDAYVVFQHHGAHVGTADNGFGEDGAGTPVEVMVAITPAGTLPEGTKDATIGSVTVSLSQEKDIETVMASLAAEFTAAEVTYGVDSADEVSSGGQYILNEDLDAVSLLIETAKDKIHSDDVSDMEKNQAFVEASQAFYALKILTKE